MQKSIFRVAVIVLAILIIPVFGNIFVEGWNWGPFDFLAMGMLLFITGLAIDFVIRKVNNPGYRALSIIAIIFVLILLWTELAVYAVSRSIDLLF